MVKASWGTKRSCQSCGARFYDMRRDPIHCPKCAAVYDPEIVLKARRGRAAPAEKAPAKVVPVVADLEIVGAEPEIADEELVEIKDDEEEEDLIEDASELGEDEDEVGKVIEPDSGEEET